MRADSFSNIFNTKPMWYLTTVCGFTVGWVTGGAMILYAQPLPWLEILFWAIPACGAGLGMGLGQWSLIRRIHKNAYLWIPVTTIGVIISVGGMLLITMTIIGFFSRSLSAFFAQFIEWFIPWLVVLTVISPIAILIGPLSQWLIVRDIAGSQSSKEILKMCIGWIVAILLLGIMLLFTGTIFQVRNDMINLIVFGVSAIPSGLVFAHATMSANRAG